MYFRNQLDCRLKKSVERFNKAQNQLSEYRSVGPEFQLIVKSYANLMKAIHDSKFDIVNLNSD